MKKAAREQRTEHNEEKVALIKQSRKIREQEVESATNADVSSDRIVNRMEIKQQERTLRLLVLSFQRPAAEYQDLGNSNDQRRRTTFDHLSSGLLSLKFL